jgi:hypothetical protein
MRRLFAALLALPVFVAPAFAQAPAWQVNPAGFEYQATVTAVVQVDTVGALQPGNLLAVMKNGTLYGIASPLAVGSSARYFLQVYNNAVTDTLELYFYHAQDDTVLKARQPFVFREGDALGSVENPVLFRFFNRVNLPPVWRSIPGVSMDSGDEPDDLDLSALISDEENDALTFSASARQVLVSVINNRSLRIRTPSGFAGTDTVTVVAQEAIRPENRAETRFVVFVRPEDIGPQAFTVAPVLFLAGDSTRSFPLNTFFVSPDGDALRVAAFATRSGNPVPRPGWSVNPAAFERTMNVIATVNAYGNPVEEQAMLSAWVGSELRGVAEPARFGNQTRYFMTVYGASETEKVRFRLWDGTSESILEAGAELPFSSSTPAGTFDAPFVIETGLVHISQSENQLNIHPLEGISGIASVRLLATEFETGRKKTAETTVTITVDARVRPKLKSMNTQLAVNKTAFDPVRLDTLLLAATPEEVNFDVKQLAGESFTFTVTGTPGARVFNVSSTAPEAVALFRIVARRIDLPAAADSIDVRYEKWADYSAPKPFALRTPEHNATLDAGPVVFVWERSIVYPGKTAAYALHIMADDAPEPVIVPALTDTVFTAEGSNALEPGKSYTWWVVVNDGTAATESSSRNRFTIRPFVSNEENSRPVLTALLPNYPNPFNPSTTLRFSIRETAQVSLDVFEMTGRHVQTVVSGVVPAGSHQALFNAAGLSSGMYMIRLRVGHSVVHRKMTLLK